MMHHAFTLLVMASIVASAPTYASGSCLSYGHSCWGAHGKRSGDGTRWMLSRMAPIPLQLQQRTDTGQWISKALRGEEQARLSDSDVADGPVVIPDDTDLPREELPEERQVILMEQPPRLFKILSNLPRNAEVKSPLK